MKGIWDEGGDEGGKKETQGVFGCNEGGIIRDGGGWGEGGERHYYDSKLFLLVYEWYRKNLLHWKWSSLWFHFGERSLLFVDVPG